MDVQNGRNTMSKKETTNESRRDFIKKAAYTAPVIMTIAVTPAMAAVGSSTGNTPPPNQGP